MLPKAHTPSSGTTLRSLSHHLAGFPACGVDVRWERMPTRLLPARHDGRSLNVLLLPWPLAIPPKAIQPVRPLPTGRTEDGSHRPARGAFTVDLGASPSLAEIARVVDAAETVVDRVHVVLLPELALPAGTVADVARRLRRVVVSGTGTPAKPPGHGRNGAEIAIPLESAEAPDGLVTHAVQAKHHPWRIDASQIVQYGLGSSLSPQTDWWEAIDPAPRTLTFRVLQEGLVFCLLVCEDLARQDPAAPLVRAVGPDLVIALLMDGPQLDSRWSARYASVLADDPGSSVLTVTSLGMATLCRPPGKAASRIVGLWRDPVSSPRELELPDDSVGLVLSLSWVASRETTLDGRSDDATSTRVVLTGVHPVPGRIPARRGRGAGTVRP